MGIKSRARRERSSILRELVGSAISAPHSVHGLPTTAGCEDVDECNLSADTALPLSTPFDSIYPVEERVWDVRNETNTELWGTLNVCERRPPPWLPPTFGSPTLVQRPHVCQTEPAGSYTCLCADGYRLAQQSNSVWSVVDRFFGVGSISCVEQSCFEYKCFGSTSWYDMNRWTGPGLYWLPHHVFEVPDALTFLKNCFNGTDVLNGGALSSPEYCCSAMAFEVLHCLSHLDSATCANSTHFDDAWSLEIQTAIENKCGVNASEFEERADLELELTMEAEIFGAAPTIVCDDLQVFSLADGPLFLRELRRDVFAQLAMGGATHFGKKITALRDLIHFVRFRKASQSCVAGAIVTQQYFLVLQLRQWPMPALANLTLNLAEKPTNSCTIVLNLTDARVPVPLTPNMQTTIATVHYNAVLAHNAGIAGQEPLTRFYYPGTTPETNYLGRFVSSGAACEEGKMLPKNRRLHFVSALEQCMLEHPFECRTAPELAAARFYKQIRKANEYPFYPGGDGGRDFSSRTVFGANQSRYFAHDVFPGGGGSNDLFEIDVALEGGGHAAEAIVFSALTNPTSEFEDAFLGFRNSSCSDISDAGLPFTIKELDVDVRDRERDCKLRCFRSKLCRSVEIGSASCQFRRGPADFDFGPFSARDDHTPTPKTCFVKDASRARSPILRWDGSYRDTLRSSGILEDCLFLGNTLAPDTPTPLQQVRLSVWETRSSNQWGQLSRIRFALNGGSADGSSSIDISSATATNPGGSTYNHERAQKLLDNSTNSKWLDRRTSTRPLTVLLDFGASGVVANQFQLTTANDHNSRDPVSWTLDGWIGNGINHWVLLHEQLDADVGRTEVPSARKADSPWYRFEVREPGVRRSCCPFLQVLFGECAAPDKCGAELVRSNATLRGYNATTGFPITSNAVPRSLSSFRQDVGGVCLAETDSLEVRRYARFELALGVGDDAIADFVRHDGTASVSRADLRDGMQELLLENFFGYAWPWLHAAGVVIAPVDRDVIVTDVFLRTDSQQGNLGAAASMQLVFRFSIGRFSNSDHAAAFADAFETLTLPQKAALLTTASLPIAAPIVQTKFFVNASTVQNFQFVALQNVTRLPERACPTNQRPSVLREVVATGGRTDVRHLPFSPPTTAGCEDIDECNLMVDTPDPSARLAPFHPDPSSVAFNTIYTIPERHHDVLEATNRSAAVYGALNVCERRAVVSLPVDFGNLRSNHQRHVCRNTVGSYSCECSSGYRLVDANYVSVFNTVWSSADRDFISGNSSCVAMGCFEHRCLSDSENWPGLYWYPELGVSSMERLNFLRGCFLGGKWAIQQKRASESTHFFSKNFLLALLLLVCWYVSSRTWDTRRGVYPQNLSTMGTTEWKRAGG